MFLSRIAPKSLRCIHTSTIVHGVDKQMLNKLRKHTGFAFIKCSNALEKFNNDIVQAEKWLKDEAQKEGWTKATKLQDRPMSQGLVGLLIKDNFASVVEVNCETDFVARNLNFQNLVNDVANALLQHGKDNNISKAELDQSQLAKIEMDGKQLGDLAALQIGSLGENILVKRGIILKSNNDEVIGSYVHYTGTNQPEGLCLLGKFASVVVCKEDPSIKVAPTEEEQTTLPEGDLEKNTLPGENDFEKNSEDEIEEDDFEANVYTIGDLARKLSQQVVGMKPSSVGEFIEKPNKSNKNKKHNKKKESTNEQLALLQQQFMFNEDVTVQDVLEVNGVRVTDFIRLECAEIKDMPIEAEPVKAEQ